jgi:hypothetical protein
MAFARNPAARHVGFRLESPSILRVASTGESTTRRRTRAGSQSTNVSLLNPPGCNSTRLNSRSWPRILESFSGWPEFS